MKIDKDKAVSLEYTITTDEDTFVEDSLSAGPLRFLQGHGNVPKDIEDAVEGMEVGASGDVTIPAEHMIPVDQATKQLKKSELPADAAVGSTFTAKTEQGGEVSFVVEAIEGDDVTVKFVHPLLGKDLTISFKVLAVRDATEKELAAGAPMAPAPPKPAAD